MNMTWMTLFGGLCIFIYGLGVARDNLEKLAGDRLRDILSHLTENRFVAFWSGLFITLTLQSSSASIAMFVGFVSSSILTLTQAMALTLGADVGATLTVQLFAFRISDYSLLIIIIGFLTAILFGRAQHSLGKFIIGIGFIYLGMWQMGNAASTFKDSEALIFFLRLIRDYPLVSVLFAALLTAMMQSSAAFLGMLLSLTHSDILPIEQALPLIIGSNIGACAFPLLVSLKSSDRGRQVAIAHLLLKVSAAVICLPLLNQLESVVTQMSTSPSRQIAHAHFVFNMILAVLFLPMVSLGAKLIHRLYPLKPLPEAFKPKYLDPHMLATPSFAFGQAKLEVIRLSGIVQEMLEKIGEAFHKKDPVNLVEIGTLEDRVDTLHREIKNYLIRLSQESITEEQAAQQLELVILTCDLEHVGDAIEKSMAPLVKKIIAKNLTFSKDGLVDIKDYHQKVMESFQLSISAFTTRSIELCQKVIRKKDQLLEIELELREKHLGRLRQGIPESLDTSTIHLEWISTLRRVNSFVSNIAYPILEKESRRAS